MIFLKINELYQRRPQTKFRAAAIRIFWAWAELRARKAHATYPGGGYTDISGGGYTDILGIGRTTGTESACPLSNCLSKKVRTPIPQAPCLGNNIKKH